MNDEAVRIEAAINTAGEYLLAGDPPETAFTEAALENDLLPALVANRFKSRFGDPIKWVADYPEKVALIAAATAANNNSDNQRRMDLLATKLFKAKSIPLKDVMRLMTAISAETDAHSVWRKGRPDEGAAIPEEQSEKFAKLRSEVVKCINALRDAHT